MNYTIDTPAQARAVLRALRKARGLSQAESGRLLGVSQTRIAQIEATPGNIRLDQIAKLVALLGAHLAVDDGKKAAPTKNRQQQKPEW